MPLILLFYSLYSYFAGRFTRSNSGKHGDLIGVCVYQRPGAPRIPQINKLFFKMFFPFLYFLNNPQCNSQFHWYMLCGKYTKQIFSNCLKIFHQSCKKSQQPIFLLFSSPFLSVAFRCPFLSWFVPRFLN